MDFGMGLLLSMNGKKDSYNAILVRADQLRKMVNYKLVKITINTSNQAKIIINVVV